MRGTALVPFVLVVAACRSGAATESTPAPAVARGAPATVQEAMECARSLVSERGFTDIVPEPNGLRFTAQVPMSGDERRVSNGVVRLGRVIVTIRRVSADGYPVIETSGSGTTGEWRRRAEAAAADVQYACPTRLGVRAPARPPGRTTR